MTNKEMINRLFDDANTSNALNALDCVEEKKLQTNADRIRAMSDEELTYFLCDVGECDRRCPANLSSCVFSDSSCEEAWLKWLTEEVEE